MPKDGVPKDVAVEAGVPNPKLGLAALFGCPKRPPVAPACCGWPKPNAVEVAVFGVPKPKVPAGFCWVAPKAVAVLVVPKPNDVPAAVAAGWVAPNPPPKPKMLKNSIV